MDLILRRMQDRVANDRIDGDAAHFDAVMLQCELITKLTLLGALALLDPNLDNHYRYDAEYALVRADGIGTWTYELQRLITGPAKGAFRHNTAGLMAQLSQRVAPGSNAWQRVALDELASAEAALGIDGSDPKSKTALTSFFSRFAELRNKSRGHGAQHVSDKGRAASHLQNATSTIIDNLHLLHENWFAFIKKSSGSPRAYPLSSAMRERLDSDHALVNNIISEYSGGSVYILFGDRPLSVHLVEPCEPLDLLVANGGYSDAKGTYEAISYIDGHKKARIGASDFLAPPSLLADSETHGQLELDLQGRTWANLPLRKPDYVRRRDIEKELRERLLDREIDPIVTLGGPGGIGKTSTALQVLHDLADEGCFDLILWFSSRDIDLLDVEGAVPVRPRILTFKDAADDFTNMTATLGFEAQTPEDNFANALRGSELCDRILFVFDNFETILEPVALFQVLKSHVRAPNKLLITTRFTDFKGHYPVDIGGMNLSEFEELVSTTASRLGIVSLIKQSSSYVQSLHRESWGHPYVVKIVLGQIAHDKRVPEKFERIIAKREDILDALFLRSFERLSTDAQRVFLTLCSWRSVIPQVMLEAALLRSSNDEPVDVGQAVGELLTSNMIEILRPENREEPRWINVPAAAFKFGAMRLSTHKSASTVKADRQYISMLGPTKNTSVEADFVDFGYFFARVRELLESGDQLEQDLLDTVHYLSSSTTYAWRLAMRTFAEVGRLRDARNVIMRDAPPDIKTWDLEDLRLRYDVLRVLEDSRIVEAALALLPRLLRDGEYASACRIAVSFARCFDRSWLQLSAGQKKRFEPEVLSPFRAASKHVDGVAAGALARLAGLCDESYEAAMWRDISRIRS